MAGNDLKQRVRMQAICWGIMMFVFFIVWGAIRDHGIMPAWVVINLIIWPIGAMLFGMLMYRWQKRQMGG